MSRVKIKIKLKNVLQLKVIPIKFEYNSSNYMNIIKKLSTYTGTFMVLCRQLLETRLDLLEIFKSIFQKTILNRQKPTKGAVYVYQFSTKFS